MSLTLVDYRPNAYYDPFTRGDAEFYEFLVEWETMVEGVLRRLEGGIGHVSRFRAALATHLPSALRKARRQERKGMEAWNPNVANAFVQNRHDYAVRVDALAKPVFDTITLPPPLLAADPAYNNATGIACAGTIIAPDSHQLNVTWSNRMTYSGNFPNHANDAILPGRDNNFVWVGNLPDRETLLRIKTGVSVRGLLDSTRHAEDEWFARYLTDFRTALEPIAEAHIADDESCDASILEQAVAPRRVVFHITANPCLSDDRVNVRDVGCFHYFARLVRPAAGRLPIILYYNRPYENVAMVGLGNKHAFTVTHGGEVHIHPNPW
jgi:hypothetical protein